MYFVLYLLTFLQISDSDVIVDPTLEEEGIMIGFSTFSFDKHQNLNGSHVRIGHGSGSGLSMNGIAPHELIENLLLAKGISALLHDGVQAAVAKAGKYDIEQRRIDSSQLSNRFGFHSI